MRLVIFSQNSKYFGEVKLCWHLIPWYIRFPSPSAFNGIPTSVNKTISGGTEKDQGIIGDFQNAFKWGYSKEIPMEIIQYGDPDNSGKDLKGYGQIYIRAEVYLGWGILVPEYFARIKEA